jgi:hypothetical protein
MQPGTLLNGFYKRRCEPGAEDVRVRTVPASIVICSTPTSSPGEDDLRKSCGVHSTVQRLCRSMGWFMTFFNNAGAFLQNAANRSPGSAFPSRRQPREPNISGALEVAAPLSLERWAQQILMIRRSIASSLGERLAGLPWFATCSRVRHLQNRQQQTEHTMSSSAVLSSDRTTPLKSLPGCTRISGETASA